MRTRLIFMVKQQVIRKISGLVAVLFFLLLATAAMAEETASNTAKNTAKNDPPGDSRIPADMRALIQTMENDPQATEKINQQVEADGGR